LSILKTKTNYYIITEYLPGGELYETIITWKDYTEQKASYILHQILSAIYYLHSKGIVHRDIKPENILIEKIVKKDSKEFINVKLIDFGTSNFFNNSRKFSLKVGTPYYIAPEVIKKNYTEKCDLWSCGVILYILLVGQPPFKGEDKEEILNNILKKNYSMSGKQWERISKYAKELLQNLLCYDQAKRYSAKEAIEDEWFKKMDIKKRYDSRNKSRKDE